MELRGKTNLFEFVRCFLTSFPTNKFSFQILGQYSTLKSIYYFNAISIKFVLCGLLKRPKVSRHLAEFFSWGLRQPLCENPQRSATTPRIFSVGFLGRSQKPLAICPDTFGLISKKDGTWIALHFPWV